jgi:hypothetical protein
VTSWRFPEVIETVPDSAECGTSRRGFRDGDPPASGGLAEYPDDELLLKPRHMVATVRPSRAAGPRGAGTRLAWSTATCARPGAGQ